MSHHPLFFFSFFSQNSNIHLWCNIFAVHQNSCARLQKSNWIQRMKRMTSLQTWTFNKIILKKPPLWLFFSPCIFFFHSSHVFAIIQIIARLVAVVDSEPSTTHKQKYFSPFLIASVKKCVKYNAKGDYVRSKVACLDNRLYNSYIHMGNKVNKGLLTSSPSPWPRPDGFPPSVPCWYAKSAVTPVIFVRKLPPKHALLFRKYQKPCQSSSVLKKGTRYSWASDTFKVIIFSQKCCETFGNCSSCNHVSIQDRDSQTRKNMLQSPGWRFSNHGKAIQHSLLALVQPNISNFTAASFVFKCEKYIF